MVLSRDENTYSAIEVEFNDATKHRTMRLTDHYGFSMAALDEAAVLFASRSNHGKTRPPPCVLLQRSCPAEPSRSLRIGNPSTVVYRPLASWAPNSDWQVQLEKGEEAVAVAVGHKFALVATSARYLRVYSHTGAPRSLLCHGGPLVALAASRGLAALVTHAGRGALSDDQAPPPWRCTHLAPTPPPQAGRSARLSPRPLPPRPLPPDPSAPSLARPLSPTARRCS